MDRKYPPKMFWFFVLTNFLFHFFWLSVPGIILCIIGIWATSCLKIGLVILLLDLVLSIVDQLRIQNAVMTSEHPDVRELMDAFCGPEGLAGFGKVLDEKIKAAQAVESDEEN